jgi:hypothetical protein
LYELSASFVDDETGCEFDSSLNGINEFFYEEIKGMT